MAAFSGRFYQNADQGHQKSDQQIKTEKPGKLHDDSKEQNPEKKEPSQQEKKKM